MAYGEQLRNESPRTYYTIHVWPSDELADESWGWPESWRAAYEEFAWMLSLAVATQVLEGGSFARREVEISTSIACVRFAISQTGTSIRITISGFAGPHAPGPNGGLTQQPTAIDGLVLGLRESNRYHHVVVFHGVVPAIPTSNVLPSREDKDTPRHVSSPRFVARINHISPATTYLKPMLQLNFYGFAFGHIDCDSVIRENATVCENSEANSTLRVSLPALPHRNLKARILISPDLEMREEKGLERFCPTLEWGTRSCDLPTLPNVCRELRQPQSDHMHGGNLH